jgi:hypothetical protein
MRSVRGWMSKVDREVSLWASAYADGVLRPSRLRPHFRAALMTHSRTGCSMAL